MKTSRIRRIATAAVFVAAVGLAGVVLGGVPGPDHVIFGTPRVDGELVSEGEVTLVLDGETDPVATYTLGSDPSVGPLFILRVPMEEPVGERTPGYAREGDGGTIYVGGQAAGTVVIGAMGTAQRLDVDTEGARAAPGISIGDVTVQEGDGGAVAAVFEIWLTKPTTEEVRVDWVTRPGTAVGGWECGPGVDYEQVSGVARIAPGDTSTTVTVEVCGDDDPEEEESFTVELSSPEEATLLDPKGVCTILDDDTPPEVSVDDLSVIEPETGTEVATFTISLDHAWEEDVTVSYATADGTAEAGSDYGATSGTVVIPAGSTAATVDVQVYADSEDEADEAFSLDVVDVQGGTIGRGRGTCTIVDAAQVLRFVEAISDETSGIERMAGAFSVAVSPDGAHVYVTGHALDALLVFARDAASGGLTLVASYDPVNIQPLGSTDRDGLGGPEDVVVSPDGKFVYVAAADDGMVTVFARNDDPGSPDYGTLQLVEKEKDGTDDETDSGPEVDGLAGVTALAISPDGATLYAAGFVDQAVAVFSIDGSSGKLSFEEAEVDGQADAGDLSGTVTGLGGPVDVAVSHDGRWVYAVGSAEGAVVVFRRDVSTANGSLGHIAYVQTVRDGTGGASGMKGASAVAVSPDDANVYVTGWDDDAVQVFARQADGTLQAVGTITGGPGGVPGLDGPSSIAVSGDGRLVYVGSWGEKAVTVLLRAGDGALTWRETKREGIGGVTGLWGPVALAVSPDDTNVYVAGYLDDAVAVFARDTEPPAGLVVHSTTHTEGAWSALDVIGMEWSGATDGPVGSGVAGYSYEFTNDPDTVVDTTLEMAHGTDPHAYSGGPMGDGEWWFHIRVCDFAGNCSGTIHAGPYLVDTTGPEGPADVESTSHVVGVPNDVDAIAMEWTAATDGESGLGGYAAAFDHSPAVYCPGAVNLGPAVTSTSSGALADGHWYFHICAVDGVGNVGAPVVVGPYIVGTDETAPWATSISAVAPPDDDDIEPGEDLVGAVTQLLVRYSEAMWDPAEDATPGDVTNPGSYLVVSGGPDGVVDTAACGAPAGDDVVVPVTAVRYEPTELTAALALGVDRGLEKGPYAVLVCGSSGLRDLPGNVFDGDRDGSPGGDLVLPFQVIRSNLLLDPNADEGLAGWALSDPGATEFTGDDAHGEPVSGAIRIRRVPGMDTSVSISQCVELTGMGGWPYVLLGLVSVWESPDAQGPVAVMGAVDFFADPDCEGSQIGDEVTTNAGSGDTGGTWIELFHDGAAMPTVARSALVSYRAVLPDGSDSEFDVWFDDMLFAVGNPSVVRVSVGNGSAVEGDTGTAVLEIPIALSRQAGQTVRVDWATVDGTAVAGEDYVAASGTVEFAPGETATTVPVEVIGDTEDEADETFMVVLSNPVNAVIGQGTGVGTIVDDDARALLSGDAAQVCESLGTVPVRFELDRRSAWDVTFEWATVSGSATAGEDFPAASGTATIPAGLLVTEVPVGVTDDGEVEPDETFEVRIVSVEHADGGTPAEVTILDEDPSGRAGDVNRDCEWDARDLAELVHVLTDSSRTYTPAGNPDCDGSGGEADVGDLECLLGTIFGGAS